MPTPPYEPACDADLDTVSEQLQREPRGVVGVAHRCPCGKPDVVATAPRLPDGTPFPTTYYLTCPRAAAACSTCESSGAMIRYAERLSAEPDFAAGYARAHRHYLADRWSLGEVPEIDGVSAGGMPDRVKCLHALVAHALAAGPGVNPVGDDALAVLGAYWNRPCLSDEALEPT